MNWKSHFAKKKSSLKNKKGSYRKEFPVKGRDWSKEDAPMQSGKTAKKN